MTNAKRIYAPNDKKLERLEYLRNVIIDGQDAEAVLVYAERLLNNIKEDTLEKLAKPSANIDEAVLFYRIALAFVDMLKRAADEARRKEGTFNELRGKAFKEE